MLYFEQISSPLNSGQSECKSSEIVYRESHVSVNWLNESQEGFRTLSLTGAV